MVIIYLAHHDSKPLNGRIMTTSFCGGASGASGAYRPSTLAQVPLLERAPVCPASRGSLCRSELSFSMPLETPFRDINVQSDPPGANECFLSVCGFQAMFASFENLDSRHIFVCDFQAVRERVGSRLFNVSQFGPVDVCHSFTLWLLDWFFPSNLFRCALCRRTIAARHVPIPAA